MSTSERVALRALTALDPDKLRKNMKVRAYEPDAEKYWAAVVTDVFDEEGERYVMVKFSGSGTRDENKIKVRASELRPYEELELVTGKRRRTSVMRTTVDTEVIDDDEPEAAPQQQQNVQQRAQQSNVGRKRPSENGEVPVWRILGDRKEDNDGATEYHTVFMDGTTKWLKEEHFYDKDGTGTAAFLAYVWRAGRIVQTFGNGEELLIAWKGRNSGDWSRVPPTAFSPAELAALRTPPAVSEFERDVGIERIYQAIIKAIRSAEHKHVEFGFPTYLAAHLLGEIGAALPPKPHDQRHYGDQKKMLFTREGLGRLFATNMYPRDWDSVSASDGGSIGCIDWDHERPLTIRWYARKSGQPCYSVIDGFENPKRKPDLWLEVLEVTVRKQLSSAAADQAIAAL